MARKKKEGSTIEQIEKSKERIEQKKKELMEIMPEKIVPKKILSIDWDYFQDIDLDDIKNYPDGIETEPEVNLFIWATRYSNTLYPNFQPEYIHTNEWLVKDMIDILYHSNDSKVYNEVPVCIALSHAECYRFIKEHFEPGTPLELFNVDMHHDMFNDNTQLDCGNWVNFIMDEYPTEVSWFNREVSIKGYGIFKNNKNVRMYTDDLSELKGENFDLIFICRSDPWSPPHLDYDWIGDYIDPDDPFGKTYKNVKYVPSKEALKPRKYENMVRMLDKNLKEFNIMKQQ